MNLHNFTISTMTSSGPRTISFGTGKEYPHRIPPGSEGARLAALGDGASMLLSLFLRNPSPTDLSALQKNLQFALYEGADMQGGLLLVRLAYAKDSSDGIVLECPFNVNIASNRGSHSLDWFFSAAHVAIHVVLSDSARAKVTIVDMREMSLPDALVDALRRSWGLQADQFGPNQYDCQYDKLIARKSIHQLWSEATKF